MDAKELLEDIFKNQRVTDAKGNKIPLNSNIDRKEGEFIKSIIQTHKPKRCVEIGCAYGISSLYICSELAQISNAHHTIIDPNQSTHWKNVGVLNLEKIGFDSFRLIEKPSEVALPQLHSDGEKFDFGFIDGWHTFDHTLIDFFYLNRMIDIGGIIVIDDISFASINKFMRYIMNYPAYEVIGGVKQKISKNRKYFNLFILPPFRLLSKIVPEKFKYEIFSGKIVASDRKLYLNHSMIALKKVKNDDRPWNWYHDF